MSSSEKHQRYSKAIKLEAIRRVLEDEEPIVVVAGELGIRHRDNIYQWIKKYKQYGEAAFDRPLTKLVRTSTSSTEKMLEELKIEVEAIKST
jgi:transposase-like protein